MTGSIQNVLTSTIDSVNAEVRISEQTGYSLGLGAIGPEFESVKETFGELFTTPGMVGVLTAGESNETITLDGSETEYLTPFNVSIGGDFQYVYEFSSLDKITFTDLYNAFFAETEKQPGYKGLITASIIFEIEEFFGSLVKWAPLKGKLPEGSRIIDSDRFPDWFRAGAEPDKHGMLAISAGVGLDRTYLDNFPAESLDRIFYLHPANKGTVTKQLHNHCFIIGDGILPEQIGDYNIEVTNILTRNEIIDVKHILDNTTLLRGFAGINVISEIENLHIK